jgi:hypothetical protein
MNITCNELFYVTLTKSISYFEKLSASTKVSFFLILRNLSTKSISYFEKLSAWREVSFFFEKEQLSSN